MKKLVVLFSLAFFAIAAPVHAQDRSVDVTGFVTWVDLSGDNRIEEGFDDPLDLEFDSDTGYGASVNVFWSNRISTEFAVSAVNPEVTFTPTQGGLPGFLAGDLEMMPITAVLQFHFAPTSRIDPYIGAGAAYILFDELDRVEDLDDVDFDAIDFDDDVGFALNAGIDIGFTDNLAINLDAKYVPVSSSATARFATGPGQAFDIEVNPLILSAGLRWKF